MTLRWHCAYTVTGKVAAQADTRERRRSSLPAGTYSSCQLRWPTHRDGDGAARAAAGPSSTAYQRLRCSSSVITRHICTTAPGSEPPGVYITITRGSSIDSISGSACWFLRCEGLLFDNVEVTRGEKVFYRLKSHEERVRCITPIAIELHPFITGSPTAPPSPTDRRLWGFITFKSRIGISK